MGWCVCGRAEKRLSSYTRRDLTRCSWRRPGAAGVLSVGQVKESVKWWICRCYSCQSVGKARGVRYDGDWYHSLGRVGRYRRHLLIYWVRCSPLEEEHTCLMMMVDVYNSVYEKSQAVSGEYTRAGRASVIVNHDVPRWACRHTSLSVRGTESTSAVSTAAFNNGSMNEANLEARHQARQSCERWPGTQPEGVSNVPQEGPNQHQLQILQTPTSTDWQVQKSCSADFGACIGNVQGKSNV